MRENEFRIITEAVEEAMNNFADDLLDRIALSVKEDPESILVFLDTGALAVDEENGKAIVSKKERDTIINETLSNKQLRESCFVTFEKWLDHKLSASEVLKTDVNTLQEMYLNALKERLYKRFVPYKFKLDDVI